MNSAQVSGIAGVIEYFMHPVLKQESDRRHRARILIVTLLFFAFMMGFISVAIVLASFPLASKLAAVGICISMAIGCLLGLLALRRRGRFVLCSMLTVAVDVLAITGGILVSGGGAVSPVTQLLAFPPLLGFFFGGVRWGSITAAIALFEIVVFAWLARQGVQFYTANDPDKASDAQLVIGIVGLVAISAMAFIYEYTSAMLKRERDYEHARVNELARIDALTGISNRHGFDAQLTQRIKFGDESTAARCFTLCCLDLDGFKPINDQYGHDVGDEVLRAVSARLQEVLRNSDCVGRHGGDEFLLILDSLRDMDQLRIVADRLLQRIAEPIVTGAGTLTVGGSFGFAIFPDHAANADALKYAADAAMYAAKRDRSGWQLYEPAETAAALGTNS